MTWQKSVCYGAAPYPINEEHYKNALRIFKARINGTVTMKNVKASFIKAHVKSLSNVARLINQFYPNTLHDNSQYYPKYLTKLGDGSGLPLSAQYWLAEVRGGDPNKVTVFFGGRNMLALDYLPVVDRFSEENKSRTYGYTAILIEYPGYGLDYNKTSTNRVNIIHSAMMSVLHYIQTRAQPETKLEVRVVGYSLGASVMQEFLSLFTLFQYLRKLVIACLDRPELLLKNAITLKKSKTTCRTCAMNNILATNDRAARFLSLDRYIHHITRVHIVKILSVSAFSSIQSLGYLMCGSSKYFPFLRKLNPINEATINRHIHWDNYAAIQSSLIPYSCMMPYAAEAQDCLSHIGNYPTHPLQVYYVHGGKDNFIPPEMSRALYEFSAEQFVRQSKGCAGVRGETDIRFVNFASACHNTIIVNGIYLDVMAQHMS